MLDQMIVVFRRARARRILALVSVIASIASVASAQDGATLFAQNCAACHQKQGQGIKGAFPALAGDALVQGSPDVLAKTVLYGRGGMPAFAADLSDAQLAAVLSYVRSAWGNKAPGMTVATIAHTRSAADPHKSGVVLQAH